MTQPFNIETSLLFLAQQGQIGFFSRDFAPSNLQSHIVLSSHEMGLPYVGYDSQHDRWGVVHGAWCTNLRQNTYSTLPVLLILECRCRFSEQRAQFETLLPELNDYVASFADSPLRVAFQCPELLLPEVRPFTLCQQCVSPTHPPTRPPRV